jgi:hypothetical protein
MTNDGRTPLYLAAEGAKVDVIHLLVRTYGANVLAQSTKGTVLQAVRAAQWQTCAYVFRGCVVRSRQCGLSLI